MKLGDKIRKVLETYSILTHCGTHEHLTSTEQVQADQELDKLLNENAAYEKSLDYGASVSIGHYQAKVKKLEDEYEEKCQELEADHAASEEVIEELTIEYNKMCEENKQHEEDSLLWNCFCWYYEKSPSNIEEIEDKLIDYKQQLEKEDERKKLLDKKASDKKVQVCSSCLRACCWYGEFMCEDSLIANVTIKTVEELEKLDLEHEQYWSDEYMKNIYGESNPFKDKVIVEREGDNEKV